MVDTVPPKARKGRGAVSNRSGRFEALAHETVDDGQAAVETVARGGWDVVLMDVQMPVLDGYAATRRTRAAEAAAGAPRLPVIAIVGFFVYGEALDVWVFIGALVIFAGNYLNIWTETRKVRVV